MITTPMFETQHDASLPLGFMGARLNNNPDRVWVCRPAERLAAFRDRIARDLGRPAAGEGPWAVEIFMHPATRVT